MDILIKKMTLNDLNLISLKDFDDFWTDSILHDEILSPNSFYIIAKYQNDIIGFAGIKFLLDEAHITNIAVKLDNRKNGIRFFTFRCFN